MPTPFPTVRLRRQLEYVLLQEVYEWFDNGGESARSIRSRCLEAVLFNIPHAIRRHPDISLLKIAREENKNHFIHLANQILRLNTTPKNNVGLDAHEALMAKHSRQIAVEATQLLKAWLAELRTTHPTP